MHGDLQRRVNAILTVFRSDGGKVPEGYTVDGENKLDTVNGDLSWWLLRNPHILEIHGLYMEHPVATVVRVWKKAKEQGREPILCCHLQSTAPDLHARIYFPDNDAVTEWKEFQAAGYVAGISYEAWLGVQPKQKQRPKVIAPAPSVADTPYKF